jgi:cell division protein FtsW (lipid II flippase)
MNERSRFEFNSYGIVEYTKSDRHIVSTENFPFFIGTIALILIGFLTLMSYKKLDRQFKLGRMTFYIYFVMLISVITLAIFGGSILSVDTGRREMGIGFFLFVAGFPFSFLSNTGIKRDKKLLESLDRLR